LKIKINPDKEWAIEKLKRFIIKGYGEASEQKELALAEQSAAQKEWSKEELIAKGETVYANNCASCHMADGAGMAGVFPAIVEAPL
jgi:mono/diheme cytochrome c family protein